MNNTFRNLIYFLLIYVFIPSIIHNFDVRADVVSLKDHKVSHFTTSDNQLYSTQVSKYDPIGSFDVSTGTLYHNVLSYAQLVGNGNVKLYDSVSIKFNIPKSDAYRVTIRGIAKGKIWNVGWHTLVGSDFGEILVRLNQLNIWGEDGKRLYSNGYTTLKLNEKEIPKILAGVALDAISELVEPLKAVRDFATMMNFMLGFYDLVEWTDSFDFQFQSTAVVNLEAGKTYTIETGLESNLSVIAVGLGKHVCSVDGSLQITELTVVSTSTTNPNLEAIPTHYDVPASPSQISFIITNTGGGTISWNASVISGSDWLKIENANPSGVNDGILYCSTSGNTTSQERNGTILLVKDSIYALTLTVTQGRLVPNLPPKVSAIFPKQGSTAVPIEFDLLWSEDSSINSYDIYFGIKPPGTFQENVAYSGWPRHLDHNKTYFWRIDSRNKAGITVGDVWQFTTIEAPPKLSVEPLSIALDYKSGITNIIISNIGGGQLKWRGDVDSSTDWMQIVSSDSGTNFGQIYVYYYENTSTNNRFAKINITTDGSTKVINVSQNGSPLSPPEKALHLLPKNIDINVDQNCRLMWLPGKFAESYDVYVNGILKTNTTETSLGIKLPESGNLYSWRIDSRNAQGVTPGNTWSFKTAYTIDELKLSIIKSVDGLKLIWSEKLNDFKLTYANSLAHTSLWESVSKQVKKLDGYFFQNVEGKSISGFFKLEHQSMSSTLLSNMVWINPGIYTMGSPLSELDRQEDEGPQTIVAITKGFWIGKYEVTRKNYYSIINSNLHGITNADYPINNVSWYDAVAFCEKLNEHESILGRLPAGYKYRLPTEAEWEYVCRAGTTTRFYYGDDLDYSMLSNYAWYLDNGSSWHPVGQKMPNSWGCFDMTGNMWEWCLDWYGNYSGSSTTNPNGISSGSEKVVRGGNYGCVGWRTRSSIRFHYLPSDSGSGVSFRVVLAPNE